MRYLMEEYKELAGSYTIYEAPYPSYAETVAGHLERIGLKRGIDFQLDGSLIEVLYQSDTAEVQDVIRHWDLEEY